MNAGIFWGLQHLPSTWRIDSESRSSLAVQNDDKLNSRVVRKRHSSEP